MTTVLSVMAHNGRLPFSISFAACNRADATGVDRISSFCRTGFLGSPDFHISRRSQSCFTTSRFFSAPVPMYLSLSLSLSSFQLQQLWEIMEKPRGETEITDVLPACRGEIDGKSRDGGGDGGGRVSKRERCRERGER